MASDPRAEKKLLRQQIKDKLAHLQEEDVVRESQAAQTAIKATKQYQQAQRISIYLSMPTGELQTDGLIRDALGSGKKLFVPFLHKAEVKQRRMMDMLRLTSLEEYVALERDAWGIPTLPARDIALRENSLGGTGLSCVGGATSTADAGLDLIILPGVAFDARMGRLGHGAGFYDSYLTRYSESAQRRSRPFLGMCSLRYPCHILSLTLLPVGLCLGGQLLPPSTFVPMTVHDWRMDAVVAGSHGFVQAVD